MTRSPPAGDDVLSRIKRAAWRLVHPRSFAGLYLRAAVAVAAVLWLADALGVLGGG